jgi:hypothetical protein
MRESVSQNLPHELSVQSLLYEILLYETEYTGTPTPLLPLLDLTACGGPFELQPQNFQW